MSWAETARDRGHGVDDASEAARWVIGPRSFRRLWPAIGWLGPLAFARPAHAFAAQCDAILAADDSMADELANITVPTLIIVGNQDILTPRGDSEELAELIPNAELVVITGAAHGVMVEHASTFNRVLLDFLGRAETAHRRLTDDAERSAARQADRVRIVVVGAGLAGLTAAPLADCRAVTRSSSSIRAGHPVAGWRRGGSATRRSTTARSSSPFVATRSRHRSTAWEADGIVQVWCHGFSPEGDGFPRTSARAG